MNAVERVKKAFDETSQIEEAEFISGYNQALDDVQAELDKEVSCDWEKEIAQLKAKHKCDIAELKEEKEKLRISYCESDNEKFLYRAEIKRLEGMIDKLLDTILAIAKTCGGK